MRIQSTLRFVSLLVIVLSTACLQAQDTTQHVVIGRINGKVATTKPYVILISADGFRADFATRYHAANLLRLSGKGVRADYMQPSYPSLTFPNHYSIVTGLYPAHHGLVDNSFYDPTRDTVYSMGNKKQVTDPFWYGGTPLWVLAEKQSVLSASFYWVASETNIQGMLPTYYYVYNDKIKIDSRLATVKKWLELPASTRPHLITIYFPEVDHAAHTYGPDSKETADAVQFVDDAVGKLQLAADAAQIPVDFIFLSDHGMTTVDNKNTLPLPPAIDTAKFYVPAGDALLHVYAKDKNAILPTYLALQKEAKDFDVYLAEDIPEKWHYSRKDDHYNRVGDMLLVPHLPKVFNITNRPPLMGRHGFDPFLPDMHAIFYAWGPAFKQGITIPGFENIHVYPLIANILGLKYDPEIIDGKAAVLAPILLKSKHE